MKVIEISLAFLLTLLTNANLLAETIILEAENGRSDSDESSFVVREDASASGNRFVTLRSRDEIEEPILSFDFELAEASTVRTFIKVRRTPLPGEAPAQEVYEDTLQVRFDERPWQEWTIENLGHVLWNWNSHDYPAWSGPRAERSEFAARFGPDPLWKNELPAGKHRFQILGKPNGPAVGIDQIVLTTDMDYRPRFLDRRQGVFFHDGFENDFSQWLWETVSSGDTEISTKYARVGESSARIELNFRGDTTHREELMVHGIASRENERWVAFSMLFPKGGDEDWAVDSKNNDIVFQVHAFPDPDENWVVPPISMNSSNGDWMIFLATDADTSLNDKQYDFIGPIWRAPYETGVWTDWVYHFKFDHHRDNPKGFLEVWKDGEKVVDMHDVQIGQNDVGASNVKTGIYKTNWRRKQNAKTDVKRRVVYVDEFRIGDADSKFEDFFLPPEPTGPHQTAKRLPIVRQSVIRVSSAFTSDWPLENLIRYAEGRDYKRQEIVDERSTLLNDIDDRFQWLSGEDQTTGDIRFEFTEPQTIDAVLFWPFPAYDATYAWPPVHAIDQPTHGGHVDLGASAQNIAKLRVTLLDANGNVIHESPSFEAKQPAPDQRIEGQTFAFDKTYPNVAAAVIHIDANYGGSRTGASAIAFRTAESGQ